MKYDLFLTHGKIRWRQYDTREQAENSARALTLDGKAEATVRIGQHGMVLSTARCGKLTVVTP